MGRTRGSDQPKSWHIAQPCEALLREILVVTVQRFAAGLLEERDCGPKTDRTRDVRRARLVLQRTVSNSALLIETLWAMLLPT